MHVPRPRGQLRERHRDTGDRQGVRVQLGADARVHRPDLPHGQDGSRARQRRPRAWLWAHRARRLQLHPPVAQRALHRLQRLQGPGRRHREREVHHGRQVLRGLYQRYMIWLFFRRNRGFGILMCGTLKIKIFNMVSFNILI